MYRLLTRISDIFQVQRWFETNPSKVKACHRATHAHSLVLLDSVHLIKLDRILAGELPTNNNIVCQQLCV